MKITKEVLNQVKQVPPGSIGVESGKDIVASGIKLFFILRIILVAVAKKKITISKIWQLFKALKAFKVNHIFIYLGSGEHVTIDAEVKGIQIGNLLNKIKKGSKIKMYFNNSGTMEGLQLAKEWAYSRVGNPYSYQDFIAFVGRLITEIFPAIPVVIENNKDLEHCSELSVRFCDILLTNSLTKQSPKLLPKIKIRDQVHPQDIQDYLSSKEGKEKGWVEVFSNK